MTSKADAFDVIPGWSEGPDLRCAIAHRGISRFRVRLFEPPRNDSLDHATSDSFGKLATTDWLRPPAFAA
ncbi:hypothetical protein Bdiaspc4_07550 [Bradyrhizobium diazoefficiens]|nr:hypothetical protein Bdiaspc4_07550 [Bradyrhizobium diazoefficiens]QHP73431.1 hypothetical protein EI171_43070 [Bradyrhizobium sp. LCT2]